MKLLKSTLTGGPFGCVPSVPGVLDSGGVVAKGLAVSLDKLLEWAIGLFSGNVELSLEL